MGPRSCERGKPGPGEQGGRGRIASMGPRSCERGKLASIPTSRPYSSGLQWGRVRVNAERLAVLWTRLSKNMLQWGRVRVNAERPRSGTGDQEVLVASMGPRSCERGKHKCSDM